MTRKKTEWTPPSPARQLLRDKQQKTNINRHIVVAKQRAKENTPEGIAAAATHIDRACRLSGCGSKVAWHYTDGAVIPETLANGEVREARRTLRCGLSECQRCCGRAHSARADVLHHWRHAEAMGAMLFQFVLHPFSTKTPESAYRDGRAQTEAIIRTVVTSTEWQLWAQGGIACIEMSPWDSTKDTVAARHHVHFVVALKEGLAGEIPPALLALLEQDGEVAKESSLLWDSSAETFFNYVTKGLSPTLEKESPLVGAPYRVVDDVLRSVVAKDTHLIRVGTWTADIAKPVSLAENQPKAKQVKVTTVQQAQLLMGTRVRTPKPADRESADASLFVVDKANRKRHHVLDTVVFADVC